MITCSVLEVGSTQFHSRGYHQPNVERPFHFAAVPRPGDFLELPDDDGAEHVFAVMSVHWRPTDGRTTEGPTLRVERCQ